MQRPSILLSGFHLIELLITLAIIGLVTAAAVPVYSTHVVTARRLEAASLLLKLAAAMDMYHMENNTYEHATLDTFGFPEDVIHHSYKLIIQSSSASDYQLKIAPQGWQAEHDSSCGGLTLTSRGQKGITGDGQLDDCW